ncbi:MAG: hypothetical protein HYV42_02115 [Candidatus Magasanikbacteria bacterium]|nr:hypothetical protein [Candidatus Magasanikbacteria bacterium]
MTDGNEPRLASAAAEPPRELLPRPPERPRLPDLKPEAAPEATPETVAEKEAAAAAAPAEEAKPKLRLLPRLRKTPPALPKTRDEVTVRIEKILEEGVGDAFARLSPVAKEEFKLKGEETARAIRTLLQATHVKVKKIFRLILAWLKMLPGINRFFLEQEAKIKTDKIIALHQRQRQK